MNHQFIGEVFLESVQFRFDALKAMGDKALMQCGEADFHWTPGPESNSIAVIVQHLHGNMMSRWTDFLTSDGDKPWRDRDSEFDASQGRARDELMRMWNEGWTCLAGAIRSLTPDDLLKDVTIRGQALGVVDAIERQVAHYAYHVGQIVYLARMRRGPAWETLSIAPGQSSAYKPSERD